MESVDDVLTLTIGSANPRWLSMRRRCPVLDRESRLASHGHRTFGSDRRTVVSILLDRV
jgi:hypothetical protein